MSLTLSTRFYINLTANPVRVVIQGGSPDPDATDYKYMLKVESTDNKLVGAPFYDAVTPDQYMAAEFDIQGYIDQPVQNTFQWPVSGGAILRTDPTFEIELTAGERYIDVDGKLVETWDNNPTPIIGFKGGVSQRQLDIWGNGSSFESIYLQNMLFLTQRPQDDICHIHQPVKLWWYQAVANTVNKLKLTSLYSDGSTNVKDVSVTATSIGLYEFNVNPYHHSVALTSGSAKLISWTVALYLNTTLVTDIRKFAYDYGPYCERPFWLMFANSLGGIDDIYFKGFATEGFSTQGNIVYKPALQANTVYDRTLIAPNRSGRNAWKINTGYKTATQMLHLRDMLLSRECWLLYPNNGVTNYYVIPVTITNSNTELVDRMKDMYEMTIEMEEAHNNRFSFDNRLY
jgi:hypothetical protein